MEILKKFRDDTDVVKIISGVRRCGKSTLMMQYIDVLKDSGVSPSNIVYINLEMDEYVDVRDRYKLMEKVKERAGEGMNYVLIDEIQNVSEWEIAVNALRAGGSDVYITGSNSQLPSSELSTHLTGRYVSMEMLPLSFREYTELYDSEDRYELFERYLRYGGFPSISPFDDDQTIRIRLSDMFVSIIYKDVLHRGNIRDPSTLDTIVRFMMSNVGNPISMNNIAKGTGLNVNTVGRYVKLLEDAYVFYRVDRYDLENTMLNPNSKYYSVDTGLRNRAYESVMKDHGRMLENIVYLELKRRRYDVRVGRFGDKEIDFSVRTPKGQQYYQVTVTMADEKVAEREQAPLMKIKDNYPKIILSTDRYNGIYSDGILHMNIVDWLLDETD